MLNVKVTHREMQFEIYFNRFVHTLKCSHCHCFLYNVSFLKKNKFTSVILQSEPHLQVLEFLATINLTTN